MEKLTFEQQIALELITEVPSPVLDQATLDSIEELRVQHQAYMSLEDAMYEFYHH